MKFAFKNWFKDTKKAEMAIEKQEVDFDATITIITNLSHRAQTTFLYKLVGALPHPVAKVLFTYVQNRLKNGDKDNQQRPVKRDPPRNTREWDKPSTS